MSTDRYKERLEKIFALAPSSHAWTNLTCSICGVSRRAVEAGTRRGKDMRCPVYDPRKVRRGEAVTS